MERKNMVLLTVIAVATLLVAVIGATFAFFSATVQDDRGSSGDNGQTNITAGSVSNKTIVANISGAAGKFTATDIYPGHMEVAALQVTADNQSGDKDSVTDIAIKYDVTQNTFKEDEIKVSLYRGDNEFTEIKQNDTATGNNYFNCTHQSKLTTSSDYEDGQQPAAGTTKFYETCEKGYEDLTSTGKLTKVGTDHLVAVSKDTITFEDKITANTGGTKTNYYYLVLEFVDKKKSAEAEGDTAQNESMNAKLIGTISVVPA